MTVGNLVTLSIESDGLHIKLDPEGREYLESEIDNRLELDSDIIFFKHDYEAIMCELLEPIACNSSIALLSDDQGDYNFLGALTAAPIIAYDVERDDQGNLKSVGRVFWYPQYAIRSELEDLLNDGEVIFEEAKESE